MLASLATTWPILIGAVTCGAAIVTIIVQIRTLHKMSLEITVLRKTIEEASRRIQIPTPEQTQEIMRDHEHMLHTMREMRQSVLDDVHHSFMRAEQECQSLGYTMSQWHRSASENLERSISVMEEATTKWSFQMEKSLSRAVCEGVRRDARTCRSGAGTCP